MNYREVYKDERNETHNKMKPSWASEIIFFISSSVADRLSAVIMVIALFEEYLL